MTRINNVINRKPTSGERAHACEALLLLAAPTPKDSRQPKRAYGTLLAVTHYKRAVGTDGIIMQPGKTDRSNQTTTTTSTGETKHEQQTDRTTHTIQIRRVEYVENASRKNGGTSHPTKLTTLLLHRSEARDSQQTPGVKRTGRRLLSGLSGSTSRGRSRRGWA